MKAEAVWKGAYRTGLTDERGHTVVVDLPADEGGGDLGPSALELNVLSLAGCITTIFALVARKRRLGFDALAVDLDADRPDGAPTITGVTGVVRVTSGAPRAEVETAVNLTLRTCPVGVLYEKAGIPLRFRTIVTPPGDAASAAPA